ncbi:hypothetical protein [Candidatus Amarobacter glycogenicus]|uniref:hypothetical protein n=1 Tax=Candidatus Amarobacter glycogenicus TaxID=3140699 RepID=UPI0031CC4BEB
MNIITIACQNVAESAVTPSDTPSTSAPPNIIRHAFGPVRLARDPESHHEPGERPGEEQQTHIFGVATELVLQQSRQDNLVGEAKHDHAHEERHQQCEPWPAGDVAESEPQVAEDRLAARRAWFRPGQLGQREDHIPEHPAHKQISPTRSDHRYRHERRGQERTDDARQRHSHLLHGDGVAHLVTAHELPDPRLPGRSDK